MQPLQLGLPLDLANEGEILAFQDAKDRIQSLMDKLGTPTEISAFAFYTSFLMKPERQKQQLANQKKYRLPIIHAQTPVQMENALTYGKEEQARFGKQSLLEATIKHVARLREYCPDVPCSMDTHLGAFVIEGGAKDSGLPCIYSPEEFAVKKGALLATAKQRFSELESLSAKNGMPLLLESVLPVVMIPDYRGGGPVLQYLPFSDIGTTMAVGKYNVTLDVAHWAGARATPSQFEQNSVDPKILFGMMEIADWEDYDMEIGPLETWVHNAKAFHLSNTNGIGVKLNKYPDYAKQWGDWGTDSGLLSKGELRSCMKRAQECGIPVMIEVDYDIKRIPENKFAEADRFLKYVLE